MYSRLKLFLNVALCSLLISPAAYSLPIDWNGRFGADTTLIDTYRRVNSDEANPDRTSMDPGAAPGGRDNASWQSYVFNLNPTLIVNDAASLKAEFSSGYAHGNALGRSNTQRLGGHYANALYHYNTSSSDENVIINQLYAELYADTATYRIGRHSAHWGLGAIYNEGNGLWDRHFSMRDGITLDIKLGNFYFEPYWSKVSQGKSLTRATNVKEWGLSLLYDNPQRDIAFGMLYGVKKNNFANDDLTADIGLDTAVVSTTLGRTNVKMINFYFAKDFNDFDIGVEVPIINGELGNLYDNDRNTDYKARGVIFESNWRPNNRWTFGFDAGRISGHDGGQSDFEALYLNPNYQVANILFRYNLHAVANDELNIYDSYITNANYYKLRGQYTSNKWTWDLAFIYAKANEVAREGADAFQHETNTQITASETNQDDNMGFEVDFGFTYQWNNEISVGANMGYLFTGDYFGYTNDSNISNGTKNMYLFQLRAGMTF